MRAVNHDTHIHLPEHLAPFLGPIITLMQVQELLILGRGVRPPVEFLDLAIVRVVLGRVVLFGDQIGGRSSRCDGRDSVVERRARGRDGGLLGRHG